MPTPVANLPVVLPTAPAGGPATGPTQPRTVGTDSPFQTILANTNPAPPATPTAPATDTGDTEPDDPITDPTLTLDASLIGLQVLVTQVLAPPENAAVAQATGQTALAEQAALTTAVPVDATAARTRADELRLDRSAGVVSPLAAPQSPILAPQATTPPTIALPQATVESPPTLPTTQPITAAVPPAAPSVATFAARPGGSSSIPAQGQILATVVPTVPVPTGLSVTAPPASEPTAPIPATALPSAQSGERPATAGEQFAADAAAGARLVASAAPTAVAFADTLNQELTAPVGAPTAPTPAAPAPGAAAAPTPPVVIEPVRAERAPAAPTRVEPVRIEPVLPGAVPTVGPSNVASEPAVAVNWDQPISGGGRAWVPLPTGTELNTTRDSGEPTAFPPVWAAAPKDESRTTETTAAPTPSIPEARLPTIEAPRAPTEAPLAKATPAAQLADTIVSHARVIERDGTVEFQMRLDPPELGQMQVRLVTRGTEIHGQVLVASEAVRGMIESQLPELRQRLEAAGVSVQRFDVSTDPGTGGNRNPYREAVVQDYFPRAREAASGPRVAARTSGTLDVTV